MRKTVESIAIKVYKDNNNLLEKIVVNFYLIFGANISKSFETKIFKAHSFDINLFSN
jgi:hypothetical protein